MEKKEDSKVEGINMEVEKEEGEQVEEVAEERGRRKEGRDIHFIEEDFRKSEA